MRYFSKQFIVSLMILAALLGADRFVVYAQTADELRAKIASKTLEIQKLEQEIKQYKDNLTVIAAKKKTLANSITELNLLRKKLDADIRVTQTKVDATDLQIRELGSQISYKKDEISSREASLAEALRAIHERDTSTLAEVALSADSFSGFWTDIDTLDQFSGEVKQNVEMLRGLKGDLEQKQGKQQVARKGLLDLKSELSDRKKIAEQNKNEQAKLLVQTNNQESSFKKILNQKIALKDAFEKELSDYESTLKFILDPSTIPPRGTKVFSSPLRNGGLFVTQQFGRTVDSVRLYASGTHNGTDFRATVGTPITAMLGGTVIGTGDTDVTCPGASYGKWVLVKHNNGLASLYAHMSLIKAQKGDVVDLGDVLGYSGNTGYSMGPHLHLTVFAANAVEVKTLPSKACSGRAYTMPVAAFNAYLNPLDYLQV